MVTPCVGVWIEMPLCPTSCGRMGVTPCVGVWIEIVLVGISAQTGTSLPAWESGLKFLGLI